MANRPSVFGPKRSWACRKSEQIFVGFGNRAKGSPVTKQIISRWLVDAITLAYSSLGLQCPIGVRAYSTRGNASSCALHGTSSGGVNLSILYGHQVVTSQDDTHATDDPDGLA